MADPLIVPVPQPVETRPDHLRWGIVSTVKAPLRKVAEFIAHHLDLGAHRIHIHLDVPDPALAERLAHPKVRFTQCDDAYWQGKPNRARETHQMRQAFNATRVYRIIALDWLAHIDVDELLLPPAPMTELLAAVDPQASHVSVDPREMLDDWGATRHFKRPVGGATKRSVYPTFGEHVPGGFISTLSPKVIARRGLDDIRFGIHALRLRGKIVRSGTTIPGLDLGHAHAPDFETFQRHLAYRLTKGSYHDRRGHLNPLGHLIRALMDDPDPDALRRFHAEMCGATPERLDLMAAHGMLVSARLDLDAKVARFFGKLEH
ncbi:glycosyltransferase family 2 protein [uncultured Tateyamaria sp.]|uniref:glycosyltransferase family 2 protein n=1 Tax=uncultured Tateyamaria sp. TaxID=455651 RepID=UPI00261712DC|nr:glycosyltransferase family 2 protein [uncultured Tateyamaria sp.]